MSSNPPPTLPGNLGAVTPVLSQRGRWVPTVDGRLTVDLGGESVGTTVLEVLDRDTVVVQVTSIVVDKSNHGYKTNSVIPVKRSWNDLSELWVPISDREIREREHLDKVRADVAAAAKVKAEDEARAAREAEAQAAAVVQQPAADPAVVPVDPPPTQQAEPQHRKVLGPRRSKVSRHVN